VTIHDPGCDCGAYACDLRAKGIRLSYAASSTMRARRPFRKLERPSWEAAQAGERRADGSFMPYITERGRAIHVKEAGERRREFSEIRNRQRQGPPPQE
jgi:hypothetical protein